MRYIQNCITVSTPARENLNMAADFRSNR